MAGPTQLHHDWVKDALNVDPSVFDTPDPDIEATLGQSKYMAVVEISQLRDDFSDSVHGALKRATSAMGDLYAIAATGWNLDDAGGAAAAVAKAAPKMTPERKAILSNAAHEINQENAALRTAFNNTQKAVNDYYAAIRELRDLPEQVAMTPQPEDDPLAEAGGDLEHLEDFINQVSQILSLADPMTQAQFFISVLHLVAGTDVIKDFIKQDSTDKKIEAINDQLDKQREALNSLISAVRQRAMDDVRNAAEDFARRVGEIRTQVPAVQAAIDAYIKTFQSFAVASGGKSEPSDTVKKAMQTYRAVLQAANASTAARTVMNTKTLGTRAYQNWAKQLVPLGKPVTDDAKTAGACVFAKGSVQTRYGATVKVMEALASGMELVVSVYADAPKADAWMKQWSTAMQAIAN